MTIVAQASRHCSEVAKLHLECLETGFRGRPGLRLLEAYYEAVVRSDGSGGFVAEEEGRVVGFVCGLWQPATLQADLLRAQWPTLIWWGIAQVLTRPRFLLEVAGRIRRTAVGTASDRNVYELRPIVVAPVARGRGIGARLVLALLADATQRGFDRVHLFSREDDAVANAFYRKVGFRPTEEGQAARAGYVRLEFLLAGS